MKRLSPVAAASILGLVLAMSSTADLRAAELKVVAGGSLVPLFKELGPQFEKASGHKLSIHFDSTPSIIARVASGTPFDAVVVPFDVFKDAGAKARFAPGTTVDIARVGYGVIVRAGAPKPDISTPDALKQTLLAAPSIAFVPASAAGAYISSVFERLGIDKNMQAKTKPESAPVKIAPAVARGEAALGVFLMNVLVAPGVELVGPFPAELQKDLVFSAAVAADSKAADAAKALIDFLRTPAAAAAIKAAGMTPG
jgi:molybdate transport system substrate-binding protein